MKLKFWEHSVPVLMIVILLTSIDTHSLVGEPGAKDDAKPADIETEPSVSKPGEAGAVSLELARDRAKMMHEVYLATLEVMHHRYFHQDRAIVPARAMEDVFDRMKESSMIEAKWISVNMKAMSIDHEPESDFEKQAALEIAAGKKEVEIIKDGYYRRAGVIPLASGCVACHGGFFKDSGKDPKYAGLVISLPIKSH